MIPYDVTFRGVRMSPEMSAVEVELPPVSSVVVDRQTRAPEDLNGVHLWSHADLLRRPLCGAAQDYHPCPESSVDGTTTHCPHCGQSVCVYCRLLT